MGVSTRLIQQMEHDGLTGKVIPVFFILRHLASNGTITMPDRREAAEQFGFSPESWKRAIQKLVRAGYISTAGSKARKYTFLTVTKYSLSNPANNPANNPAIDAKNKHESNTCNPANNPANNPPLSRSLGVKTLSLGVDVSYSGVEEVLNQKDNIVDRSQTTPPTSPPKAPAKPVDPKEAAWVKDVLLRGMDLYMDDPTLNAVNPRTGKVRIAECYRSWRDSYKNIDVMYEIRSAHNWELEHPKRVKGAGRIGWLGNWLRRQNRPGVDGRPRYIAVHKDKDNRKINLSEVDDGVKTLVGMMSEATQMIQTGWQPRDKVPQDA